MINAKAQRGRGGREGNAETQRRGGRREGLTQRCGGAKARRKSGGSEAVYDAVDSAAQESLPEINHESQFLPAQSQIGQGLGKIDGVEILDGLAFNDHEIFDQKVQPVGVSQRIPLVEKRELLLPLHPKAAVLDFPREALLVNRFKKAGASHRFVDFESRIDDDRADFVFRHL